MKRLVQKLLFMSAKVYVNMIQTHLVKGQVRKKYNNTINVTIY